MAVIKELIRTEENGTISFGNYELAQKSKLSDYQYQGDVYKVKTFKEITKLNVGSALIVQGDVVLTPNAKQPFEVHADSIEIEGASPETLVKLKNDTVHTFPLAGTRPRGKTEKEDFQLEKELLADPKELAEHNMLVDLGRNDLGKVSQFGTVEVEK